jgi:two-component sensor histidine kinase
VFAAAAVVIIAAAVAASLGYSVGPFGDPKITLDDRVYAAQVALLAVTLSALVLAALFAERRRNEAMLREALDSIKLLMREISHRAKNLLAVVQVMARHTAREVDPKVFAEQFGDRLAGLAASHDLLVKSEWRGVDTADLVRSQLAHFGRIVGTRVALDGPRLWLKPSAAQSIGMALHELGTNAAKYGALSGADGSVRVEWNIVGSGRDAHIRMKWSETGGPMPDPSQKRGFGHTVMVDMTKQALDAEVRLEYPSSGAVWELVAPLEWSLGQGTVVSHAKAGVESRGQGDARHS